MGTAPLALLIDAENIAPDHFPEIAREVRKLGRPEIQRLYGDFTNACLKEWLRVGRDEALELRVQPSAGKNSADMALAIDAMDLLHGRAVQTICIASSDRDFAPLAMRLRAGLCQVVGFGLAGHGSSLPQAYSRFHALGEKPRPQDEAAAPATQLTEGQVERLRKVLQELRILAPGSRLVYPSAVAAHLLEREPEIARVLVGKGRFVRHLKVLGLCEPHGDGTQLALTA